MLTKYTRRECYAMVRYWMVDVRHCASLVVAAKRRDDKTAARVALLKALCSALEWRARARESCY